MKSQTKIYVGSTVTRLNLQQFAIYAQLPDSLVALYEEYPLLKELILDIEKLPDYHTNTSYYIAIDKQFMENLK